MSKTKAKQTTFILTVMTDAHNKVYIYDYPPKRLLLLKGQ